MSNESIIFEPTIDKNDVLISKINKFINMFNPLEINSLNILQDNLTEAIFCECHVRAKELVTFGTTDVPLDTERQSEYKANRDVVEDSVAYNQMKEDAKKKRTFSNIVAEYDDSFGNSFPLKIIGGQHRINAISEAFKNNKINELHGIKVYFNLNMDQRLDVQLISNTNIVVSSDLLDRMFETVKGPELRDWCQKVGLLEKGKDFADKKQRGNQRYLIIYLQNFSTSSQNADKPYLSSSGASHIFECSILSPARNARRNKCCISDAAPAIHRCSISSVVNLLQEARK